MNNSKNLRRLLLINTLVVLSSAIVVSVYTQASKFQKNQKSHPRPYEAAKVTAVPEVRSTIKGLDISRVSLSNQGTPEAAIVIDVINNRDEDVMAVDFIAGKGKSTTSGLAMDGLLLENNPVVIIPRHGLKTFTWNLASILEEETIYLAAAIFADGKEEGDSHSLDGIKKTRLKSQQRKHEEKAKNGGQQ